MRLLTLPLVAVVLALSACGGDSAAPCGLNDKRFIRTAQLNIEALALWAEEYRMGKLPALQLALQAQEASSQVGDTHPQDRTLRLVRTLVVAMLEEYGVAVRLADRGRPAGLRMLRSHGFAQAAHQALTQAQVDLGRRGCDVSPLL